MAVLVVGSIALDTLTTPSGKVEETLGGSATYFSLAARAFDTVRIVGVVGPDFPVTEKRFLEEKGIDLGGMTTGQGPTFRWEGVYGPDLGDARTIRTELGVFAGFAPKLPEHFRTTPCVFLANIDPELQLQVLEQVVDPRWVAVDTMNLWIDRRREKVLEVFSKVDMVFVNSSEAKQLSGEDNLFRAGAFIQKQGPRYVVIKRGSSGVMVLGGPQPFVLPAVPLEEVVDPTGAGDSFAGGMLGYLASVENPLGFDNVKMGLACGSVTASFAVSGFGVDVLRDLGRDSIDKRMRFFLSTNQLRSEQA
jgi:sugar/nucleoside kinase (ribokinase family)